MNDSVYKPFHRSTSKYLVCDLKHVLGMSPIFCVIEDLSESHSLSGKLPL